MAKPSQTTGYLPKSIYRTQYSTDGQYLVASSGSEIDIEAGATLEVAGKLSLLSGSTLTMASGGKVNVDGELEVGSGGLVELQAGSSMVAGDGAGVRLMPYEKSTGIGGGLAPHGISHIYTTEKPAVYWISKGAKEGTHKIIIFDTSAQHFLAASSIRTGAPPPVLFNSTHLGIWPTTDHLARVKGRVGGGISLQLIAQTSANWILLNPTDASTDADYWTVSSAT
jgi:hypothetical protein